MKIVYATIAEEAEARKIGQELLKKKYTNYLNIFPVTSLYNLDGNVGEESEVVMVVMIDDEYFDEVRDLIRQEVEYDNFVGQLEVERVNEEFLNWLTETMKGRRRLI